MSSSSHQADNTSSSPTKRDSDPPAQSPTPVPPSPPQNATEDRNTTPATPTIAMLQPIPSFKLKETFPANWLLNTSTTANNTNVKTGLSVPVGRPKTPRNRNRRGLTIKTPLPNPFLSVGGGASQSPEKKNVLSRMTTPADSPTTPNSRMMFKMDDLDEK